MAWRPEGNALWLTIAMLELSPLVAAILSGDRHRAERNFNAGNDQTFYHAGPDLYAEVGAALVVDLLLQEGKILVCRVQAADTAVIFDAQIDRAAGAVGHAHHCVHQVAQRQPAQVAFEFVLQGFLRWNEPHTGAPCLYIRPVYCETGSSRMWGANHHDGKGGWLWLANARPSSRLLLNQSLWAVMKER